MNTLASVFLGNLFVISVVIILVWWMLRRPAAQPHAYRAVWRHENGRP
jgi:uncharacterized iron-regulated membrane protein